MLHPLHLAWERLPDDWSFSSSEPSLGDLVELQAAIESEWAPSNFRTPSFDEALRDYEIARRKATDAGRDPDAEVARMAHSYRQLCATIAARIQYLSPVLAALYMKQSVIPTTRVLSGAASNDSLVLVNESAAATVALVAVWSLLAASDPELLGNYVVDTKSVYEFGMELFRAWKRPEGATDIEAIANADLAPDLSALTIQLSPEDCGRLTDALQQLTDYTRAVSAEIREISELEADPLTPFLSRLREAADDNDVLHDLIAFEALTPGRMIALRKHATALYLCVTGQSAAAIACAAEGVDALARELKSESNAGGRSFEDWDRIQALKLVAVQVEARSRAGIHPAIDEDASAVISLYTTSLRNNWIDSVPADRLDEWNENFSTHIIVRMMALAADVATPSKVILEQVKQTIAETLNNSPVGAVAARVDSLTQRMDAVIDITLDIRAEQAIVTSVLSEAGETRIRLVEFMLRSVTPDWDHLSEESRRELEAGEIEYRAYLAGDRPDVHPAAIANYYWRALEREVGGLPGGLKAFDHPQWKLFKDERGYADHADQFDELALSRMRAYLFGIYRHKGSLLGDVAQAVARRAKRSR